MDGSSFAPYAEPPRPRIEAIRIVDMSASNSWAEFAVLFRNTRGAGRVGEGERRFRYAPLSSGLDIVRKTLGQQEIATVQTTAIDQTAGMVNLTTTLAHASGEWIASDWPVCPIAETANPQRMGAALTYARRYALFTLVGIAGEDDLDAPDLCDGPRSPTPSADERSLKPGHGQPPVPQRKPGNGQRRYGIHGERPSTLEPEQSAALREKLLTAVGSITSADGAAIWAQRGARRQEPPRGGRCQACGGCL